MRTGKDGVRRERREGDAARRAVRVGMQGKEVEKEERMREENTVKRTGREMSMLGKETVELVVMILRVVQPTNTDGRRLNDKCVGRK